MKNILSFNEFLLESVAKMNIFPHSGKDIEFENRILQDLKEWMSYQSNQFLNEDLKYLLKIKKDYPEILDPKKSKKFKGDIYRGDTIPSDVLKKLKFVASNEFPDLSYDDYLSYFATSKSKLSQLFDYTGKRYIPTNDIKYGWYKITSIKKIPTFSTNFVSFTTNKDIAVSFHSKGINDYQTYTNNRIPIIVKKYDTKDCVFNPDFLESVSPGYKEDETFHLIKNSEYTVEEVYVSHLSLILSGIIK